MKEENLFLGFLAVVTVSTLLGLTHVVMCFIELALRVIEEIL